MDGRFTLHPAAGARCLCSLVDPRAMLVSRPDPSRSRRFPRRMFFRARLIRGQPCPWLCPACGQKRTSAGVSCGARPWQSSCFDVALSEGLDPSQKGKARLTRNLAGRSNHEGGWPPRGEGSWAVTGCGREGWECGSRRNRGHPPAGRCVGPRASHNVRNVPSVPKTRPQARLRIRDLRRVALRTFSGPAGATSGGNPPARSFLLLQTSMPPFGAGQVCYL
jgi:hypothetical protein